VLQLEGFQNGANELKGEPAMNSANEAVRIVYELFAKGDLPGVVAKFDPEIVWFEASGFPGVGGRHVGPDAVQAVLIQVASEWEDLTVTPREFVGDGDRVVVLGETAGKYRATGRSFQSPFAHAWRLRDGRVVEWRAYIDTALAQEAAAPAD
jgi:uncharacterized protein